MEADDWRFLLPHDKYLEKTQVAVYLEDAIAQLLDHKEDNPKVNPTSFFLTYFTSVKAGNHVLLREYSFVKATAHNRSSFVKVLWKCFSNVGRNGDLLSIKEYHSLACLLCPDLPLMLFKKTAKIILQDQAVDDSPVSFVDFIYAFQLQLCFDEFLAKSSEIYRSLIQNQVATHLDAVVVPTSEERPPHPAVEHSRNGSGGRNVDSVQFFRALSVVCERMESNCPPVALLQETLLEKERTTFYEFLTNLSKNAKVNDHIGKLPPRSELLKMTEQEMNLIGAPSIDKLWTDEFVATSPQVATNPPETTKFFDSSSLSTLDLQSGGNPLRPAGPSRTESAKSSEPVRWASTVAPNASEGSSTGSVAPKGKSATHSKKPSSARVGGSGTRKKTRGKNLLASSSGSDSDDDDVDDLNSDASLSSKN